MVSDGAMDPGQLAAFWQLFREKAEELTQIQTADHPLYDQLLQCLQTLSSGLWFEFCASEETAELIITADGDSEYFDAARRVVQAAPSDLRGWTVHALKPPRGFPKSVNWEGVEVPMDSLLFEPLMRQGSPDLGLRILVPQLQEDQVEDAHEAILRAIDHGLGEEKHAEVIQHTELQPMPSEVDQDQVIPLVQLEPYLVWRETRGS